MILLYGLLGGAITHYNFNYLLCIQNIMNVFRIKNIIILEFNRSNMYNLNAKLLGDHCNLIIDMFLFVD